MEEEKKIIAKGAINQTAIIISMIISALYYILHKVQLSKFEEISKNSFLFETTIFTGCILAIIIGFVLRVAYRVPKNAKLLAAKYYNIVGKVLVYLCFFAYIINIPVKFSDSVTDFPLNQLINILAVVLFFFYIIAYIRKGFLFFEDIIDCYKDTYYKKVLSKSSVFLYILGGIFVVCYIIRIVANKEIQDYYAFELFLYSAYQFLMVLVLWYSMCYAIAIGEKNTYDTPGKYSLSGMGMLSLIGGTLYLINYGCLFRMMFLEVKDYARIEIYNYILQLSQRCFYIVVGWILISYYYKIKCSLKYRVKYVIPVITLIVLVLLETALAFVYQIVLVMGNDDAVVIKNLLGYQAIVEIILQIVKVAMYLWLFIVWMTDEHLHPVSVIIPVLMIVHIGLVFNQVTAPSLALSIASILLEFIPFVVYGFIGLSCKKLSLKQEIDLKKSARV